ncbi:hypothetical protein MUY35_13980 [Aliiroseovarius sp. S1339]|uniref:hypothetical protein n=1 Tax=Aliiroseovarius sp. S1339 TaxID=2936990 RepID=UPI0020BF41D1|nr:hypothetical protein [Aliiroseovarius sp. S1339]MCK8464963.1 hypothetical protein [Aliiroseovarius sp. S1339]
MTGPVDPSAPQPARDNGQTAPVVGKLQIAPKHLLIMLLPIAVLTASEYLLGTFGDTALVVPDVTLNDLSPLVELGARYKFLAALFFFVAVTITLTAVFAAELYTRHTRRSICYTLVGIVVVIIVSLSFSTFEPDWMPASFESHFLLGDDLFRTTLGTGKLPGCAPGGALASACADQGAFFAMKYLLNHVNILTSLSAAAIIAGMVLSLARPRQVDLSTQDGLIIEAQALQVAQETSQRYLYCSGVLLTTGMVLVLSWMSWPNAMITDDKVREAHLGVINSLSMFRGVTYTVLILSFYMPVSLILKVRIERFKRAASGVGEPELGAQLEGFDINRIASLDAFKAMLAIASPILASAIGSFAELSLFQ